MKRLLLALSLLLTFMGMLSFPSAAYSQRDLGIFGQDHYYSITFRGNGEAVVNLKVVLTNLEDTALNKVSLRVPKVDPKDLAVYQVIKEPVCFRYAPLTSVCVEYQEPDYYQFYSPNKYQKAKFELSGDTINIELPKEIKTNSSGSFVLYFRGIGYAKKDAFGAYKYSFESLKVNDKIRNLQVGIETDSDLFLKGAKGKVEYRFDQAVTSLKSVGAQEGVASPQFDNFYNQLGYGSIIKNSKDLQPLDSYVVKGAYADGRIKLYAKEILTVLGVLIVLVIFGVLGVSMLLKFARINFVLALGLSFASSILIAGYTLFINFLLSSSYISQLAMPIFIYPLGLILLAVVSLAIYVFLLVGPAIYFGFKKGVVWGFVTFGMTVSWLVLYLIAFFVVLSLLGKDPNPIYPGPIPLQVEKSVQ